MRDRTLSRRAALAAVGASAVGTSIGQVSSQEETERPYTDSHGHIECTFYDCAHVEVDAGSQSAHNTAIFVVRYNHEDGPPEGQLIDFEISYPTYPQEFVANCHLDDLDGIDSGSAVVERVEIWHDFYHDATFHPPLDWTCETVIDDDVSSEIIEDYCGEDYEGDTAESRPEN